MITLLWNHLALRCLSIVLFNVNELLAAHTFTNNINDLILRLKNGLEKVFGGNSEEEDITISFLVKYPFSKFSVDLKQVLNLSTFIHLKLLIRFLFLVLVNLRFYH